MWRWVRESESGLSGCRARGLLACRAAGPAGCRTAGLVGCWRVGRPGPRAVGLPGSWAVGVSGGRARGLSGCRAARLAGCHVVRASGRRAPGRAREKVAVTVVSKCAAAHWVGKEALVFGEQNFRGCWQSADLRRVKVPAVAPPSAPSVPELVRLRTSNQNELALVTRLRLDCGSSERKTKDAISQPPAFCIGFRNAEQPKMMRRTGP